MPSEEAIHDRIDQAIEPFSSYKKALSDLSDLPDGYRYVFATNYVYACLLNGGIYSHHAGSAWCLTPDAIEAARAVGQTKVAQFLLEVVYYYHRQGRSKLKRRMDDSAFADIPADWDRSLADLEGELFSSEYEAEQTRLWGLLTETESLYLPS